MGSQGARFTSHVTEDDVYGFSAVRMTQPYGRLKNQVVKVGKKVAKTRNRGQSEMHRAGVGERVFYLRFVWPEIQVARYEKPFCC